MPRVTFVLCLGLLLTQTAWDFMALDSKVDVPNGCTSSPRLQGQGLAHVMVQHTLKMVALKSPALPG